MKLKYFISAVLATSLLVGCHGDLDVVQKGAVSANSMWKSEEDATSAMYGLYNQFRSAFNTNYMYWGEYRTGLWGDGLTTQTSRDQVYQNQIPTDHSSANWASVYTTINEANLILKYTPGISYKNEDNKNKVMANAYFVRAFCYYWIGRIWGDAPILLDGFESDNQDGLFPSRDSAEDVFKQVESDINSALSLMPSSVSDKYLASPAAINMLKADFSLWMYKVRSAGDSYLQAAATSVSNVLNNTSYGLESDFASIFESEQGKEVILAWCYLQDEYEGGYPSEYLVPSQYLSADVVENPVKTGSHQQWCFFTDDYKALLSENENDTRTVVSYDTYFDEKANFNAQWINKYAGSWRNETRIFDSDIIIYRYADAVLFDAEIKMEQNNLRDAVVSLNEIAERAYKIEDFYSTSMSKAELKEALITERLKEFPAEGKLWWDYIRFGVAFERNPYLKGRENETNVLLWPVSQTSLNQNQNLTQTPGYDK